MCGEQTGRGQVYFINKGSPPRVRGTGDDSPAHTWKRGITPACAGNRGPRWKNCGMKEDHPRVCGEQMIFFRSYQYVEGSPPRVRGTGPVATGFTGRWGITPACAGNREASVTNGGTEKDHPRVCGEQANHRK